MRVLWTARRSYSSILKETNPEYSLKGLMLKLQHFGHLVQRANSLEKTLMLGKIEDSETQGSLACCSPWGCKEADMTENEQQQPFDQHLSIS